jgi:hypothetical protein
LDAETILKQVQHKVQKHDFFNYFNHYDTVSLAGEGILMFSSFENSRVQLLIFQDLVLKFLTFSQTLEPLNPWSLVLSI